MAELTERALISIHEGIEKHGKRGQCINIHHISSYGKNTEDLWLEAAKWIYDTYKADKIEQIYLHGDGALWIKEGLNWLPKSKLVLDKYHLNRSIIEATGRQKERRRDIYSALWEGDKKRFKEIVKQLYRNAESDNERKRIRDFRKYILNHWEAIVIYSKEACSGSCTEGHISHVLSSRLSSRPMGWSRPGLRAMAELRAFHSNGGKVELRHLRTQKPSHYKLNQKQLARAKKAFKNYEMGFVNNMPVLNRGKVLFIQKYLKDVRNSGYVF